MSDITATPKSICSEGAGIVASAASHVPGPYGKIVSTPVVEPVVKKACQLGTYFGPLLVSHQTSAGLAKLSGPAVRKMISPRRGPAP